jgi:hypothetical protein
MRIFRVSSGCSAITCESILEASVHNVIVATWLQPDMNPDIGDAYEIVEFIDDSELKSHPTGKCPPCSSSYSPDSGKVNNVGQGQYRKVRNIKVRGIFCAGGRRSRSAGSVGARLGSWGVGSLSARVPGMAPGAESLGGSPGLPHDSSIKSARTEGDLVSSFFQLCASREHLGSEG